MSQEAEGPRACLCHPGILSGCLNVCEEAVCVGTGECVKGSWYRQAQVCLSRHVFTWHQSVSVFLGVTVFCVCVGMCGGLVKVHFVLGLGFAHFSSSCHCCHVFLFYSPCVPK